MEFSVVQWVPGQGPAVSGGIVWRTCLREIAFVANGSPLPDAVEALHGEAAYAHLLNVICGLGSPIIGETEVMAQFKAFASSLPDEQAALREVSERLLIDARVVRARHLTGMGSRSYGSAVRRHTREFARVAVVGTGMLAQEILPFVPGDNRQVDLWGRRESPDWLPAGIAYRRLDDSARQVLDGRTALVVAAPLTAIEIQSLCRYYADVALLIDLRGEGKTDPVSFASVVTLEDVFAEMQAAAATSDQKAAAAREAIRDCARGFATRAKLNPSGWHDLCA
jgi:glutamyl-tRNA reductase